MALLEDLLIGDFTLLLYCSESRTRSQNSTKVPDFRNFSLSMSMFYCVSPKHFLRIVAMIVKMPQDDNLP